MLMDLIIWSDAPVVFVSQKLVRDDLEPVEVDELLFHKIRNDNKSHNGEEDDVDEEVELEYMSTDEDGESQDIMAWKAWLDAFY